VFDPKIGFFRGKYANGNFRKNIPDPAKQQSGWDTTDENGDYVEGSAWQWLWFVPQDIQSLVQLLGGDEKFVAKLDTFFDPNNVGHITEENGGYIGQYAMGNEPGHHVPYLYNYAGQAWKTQKLVRDILSQTFKPTADGLTGNDDCGQMSAWYVFGTLGLFPVNPSGGIYVFGSPAVKSAQILVGNNKTFEINVSNYGAENIYIKSIKLNGKPYDKTWISHVDIMNGAKLEFEMDKVPNKKFGADKTSYPPNDAYN
jgi:predicted alpha-1,2-mannosidase